jgi:hypothetical protein
MVDEICDECFYQGNPDDKERVDCPYRNGMDVVFACIGFTPKRSTATEEEA